MPTHHAGAGAGRIEQDAVNGCAVHHCRASPSRPRRQRTSREAQPRKVFDNPLAALGVDIERGELAIGQLQNVRRLAAGAAQASSTRMPSFTPSSGAASCAPASCTENQPSRKPADAPPAVAA